MLDEGDLRRVHEHNGFWHGSTSVHGAVCGAAMASGGGAAVSTEPAPESLPSSVTAAVFLMKLNPPVAGGGGLSSAGNGSVFLIKENPDDAGGAASPPDVCV